MAKVNQTEIVLNIFTIADGDLKILLSRKKGEPYKGYWMLPSRIVGASESLEDAIKMSTEETALLPYDSFISKRQGRVFDALLRKVDRRVFGVSYNCVIDSRVVEEKQAEHSLEELDWFSVSTLPKLAFDHQNVIDAALDLLKEDILFHRGLQELFPSDFTLPELQRVYEMITRKNCDRRNFRKKFIEQGLLEDTGYKTTGTTGRPAKLYRFTEEIEKLEVL